MTSFTGDQKLFDMWRLVDPPKHFEDGDDPIKWVKEAKLFSDISNIPLGKIIDTRVKGAAAEKWCLKADEGITPEDRFMKLFKEEKNIFQIMDEIRDVKQGKSESFDIFYERTEKLAQKFMEMKPSEAEIHKNLLLRGAVDPSIVERFAFEPEMPRKRILEVGKKLEDAVRLRKLQVNVINTEMIRQMEIERENFQAQINALKKTFAETFRTGNTPRNTPRPQGNYRSNLNPREFEQQRPMKICWHCNSTGHLKRECPNIECFQCGEKGHFARNCQNRQQQTRQGSSNACHECGNRGHMAKDCALRRKKWLNSGRVNAMEEYEDTISTIHENERRLHTIGNIEGTISTIQKKNVNGPTNKWTVVGPRGKH